MAHRKFIVIVEVSYDEEEYGDATDWDWALLLDVPSQDLHGVWVFPYGEEEPAGE